MVTSNPDIDGPEMERAQAICEKYKDFKFTHELEEIERADCTQDTNLCATDRTVPISAGWDRIKHT